MLRLGEEAVALEEKKKPTVPDWLIKLILGGTAIGVGGYLLYYWLSGAAATEEAKKQLEKWSKDYGDELAKITSENRLPTSAEEYALKKKKEQIQYWHNKLAEAARYSIDVVWKIAIAAISAGFTVLLISKLAKGYWETHIKEVKTPAAAVQLMRESIAIDLHAAGMTTLAVALHTQTQTVFQTIYAPMMQAEIATLQATIPTLTGLELMWAQFMLTSLQTELATTIPLIFTDAASILAVPPPI
jgi:predicted PurR-regulated permease PerM